MHDILEPSANEQARADYLERQMRNMSSMQLPSSVPPSGDDIPFEDESLSRRIQDYCSKIEDHRRCEKDKGMSHNLEKVKEVARSTLSRASTISAEEC